MVCEAAAAPVGEVAARLLRKRLDAVWSELRNACRDEADPETVHQLRVATRRTLAALDAFADIIPSRRRAWFEKRLARLRRAAGEARDLDVLSQRLSLGGAGSTRARGRLVAMLSKQRVQSRAPIREQLEKLLDAEWPERVERLMEGIRRRRRTSTFAAFARRRFKPMIEAFFARADHKLRAAEEIHELRIAGKQLRYALELFAPVFPAGVRSRCQSALERLQETLGSFTDHAAAADRFARWARSADAGSNRDLLAMLERDEDARADVARKSFSKWWNHARRKSLRRSFERTLRRHSA